MKNTFLIITILLLSNLGFSQVNSNYLDNTSEWKSYRGSWGQSIYSTLYFDGLESFNGNTYYKTYRNDHVITTNIFFGGVTITDELYGPSYIREDNNGVFWFCNDPASTEYIWFDNQVLLNSQIGDLYSFYSTNCTIQAIQAIPLGSVQLKRITGTETQGYTGAIEGIGEIGAVCSSGIESVSYLACYTKQDNTIQFGNMDCNLFPIPTRVNLSTNLNSSLENTINIFPNPTNGIFKVKLNSSKLNIKYKIFEIHGALIKEGAFENDEKMIDISNYSDGIYIIKIEMEGSTQFRKIIKR